MIRFWRRDPDRLVSITHVTAHRDKKEFLVRLAFANRRSMQATVDFEDAEGLATMFDGLASAVRDGTFGT
jgi:hypothetical protein